MPEETVQPDPKPNLAEAYAIGDEAPSASPGDSVSAVAATPTAETPPRDESGKFISKHSAVMRRKAKDAGFSEEDISEASPEDLRVLLSLRSAEISQASHERVVNQSGSQTAVATVASPSVDLGIDESQYDPGLVGVIKALKAEIAELRGQVAPLYQHVQRQAQETQTQFLDRIFARHDSLLGKGARSELKDGSPELARRNAVLALAQTYKGSVQENIDKAVATLYGDGKATSTAPTDIAARWREGGLAKPTHRAGSGDPAGVEKATKAVAAYKKENGYDDTTLAEEFPA